jgi:seryl-tRNA synthetase
VKASQRARGEAESLVDDLLRADEARRSTLQAFEALRAEQKQLSNQVRAAKGEERERVLARTKELAAQVKQAEAASNEAERTAARGAPGGTQRGAGRAPPGGEDDYVVLREVGDKPAIDNPRDHLELGEGLGAIDCERGAKVSGSRFYFLTGPGALLQIGLLQLAMAQAVEHGFTPMITPVLVKPESMEGTGFLGAHASEIYRLEGDDLYLVGTSEVALAAYHGNEILDIPGRAADPVRRLVVVLPSRGRLVRQGRARHHPGAPVRQGGAVRVRPARAGGRGAPAVAGLRGGVAGQGGAAVPGHRRRRG